MAASWSAAGRAAPRPTSSGPPALGIPGKATWKPSWAEHLRGLDVRIWQEPDAEDLVAAIGHDLPQAKVMIAPEGIKDVTAALIQGVDVQALLAGLVGVSRTAA